MERTVRFILTFPLSTAAAGLKKRLSAEIRLFHMMG